MKLSQAMHILENANQRRRAAEEQRLRAEMVGPEDLRRTAEMARQFPNMGVAKSASHRDFMEPADLLDYSAMAPLVGDVTGPMADIRFLYENPDERTMGNYAMAALGAAPFVPSVLGVTRKAKLPDMGSVMEDLPDELAEIGGDRAEAVRRLRQSKEALEGGGKYIGGELAGASKTKPVDNRRMEVLTDRYGRRIDMAEAAGIYPGYFYREGREALARTAEDPALAARMMAPTSTQVGPLQNTGYTLKAFDDARYANEVSVGLYPSRVRPVIDDILQGNNPWMGYKLERYAALLGAKTEDMDLLIATMPPNDQWEGRAAGFVKRVKNKKTGEYEWKSQPPSGPAQVAFVDEIRRRALEKVNARRKARGMRELSLEEAQELHWQAIRRLTEGKELGLDPEDTVAGSLDQFKLYQPYEVEAGQLSQIRSKQTPAERMAEFDEVLADERVKDPLNRAMGAEFQRPVIEGTGVWTTPSGQIENNPMRVAGSYGSLRRNPKEIEEDGVKRVLEERGISPSTNDRMRATNALRALALGQDAVDSYALLPVKRVSDSNLAAIDLGGTISKREQLELQERLNDKFGNNKVITIPSDDGVHFRWVGSDKEFENLKYLTLNRGRAFQKIIAKEFPEYYKGKTKQGSFYEAFGSYLDRSDPDHPEWAGPGGQTKMFLDIVDELTAQGQKTVDSREVRKIATEFAAVHDRLQKEGKQENADKYIAALRTFARSGVKGLRAMVKAGTAPALALAIVNSVMNQERELEDEI